jgi:murein DD-endopeptidase MepM/ murein hydrolase activator NlpD
VFNNPLRFGDPSGHATYCGDDYDPGCLDTTNGEEMYYYNLATNQPLEFENLPVSEEELEWIQWFGGTEYAYQDYLYYLDYLKHKNDPNYRRKDYNYSEYCQGFHCGIDFGAPYNTKIVAGIYGRVVGDPWNAGGGGGWKVVIQYGDYYVRYEHLSEKPLVGGGDYVTPGTVIGGVGNPSGSSTGGNFHLHLEVRFSSSGQGSYKDRIANPLLYMNNSQYEALQVVKDKMLVEYPNHPNVTFHWPVNDPLKQPAPIVRGGPVLWDD